MRSIFITGTETGVGKTMVSGLLARYLLDQGYHVVTQKWIQTGTQDGDSDIETHLRLMAAEPQEFESFGPCMVPYAFDLPASPYQAAAHEDRIIDPRYIKDCFSHLASNFDSVLVEGTGGLPEPIDEQTRVIDVVHHLDLPVLVVVANKLVSINHALLTIEALLQRDMEILGIVFNDVPTCDPMVARDNPRIPERLTGVRVLGHLPWTKDTHVLYDEIRKIGEALHGT